MRTDDLLDEIVQICRIGASPGGSQILDALYPGTLEAVRKAEVCCPVCRMPHPADSPCKSLEASDNGYTLEHKA